MSEADKICSVCKAELYKESVETGYTDELGNELYYKFMVCPNGCDGYNSENVKEAVASYKFWLKEQIQKKKLKLGAGAEWAYNDGLDIVLSLLEE